MFDNLFKKSKEFINEQKNKIVSDYKEKDVAKKEFDLIKTASKHINDFKPLEKFNAFPSEGRATLISNMSLTVSMDNVKLINEVVPLNEIIINVKPCKEVITLMNYLFIVTNSRIWLLDKNGYKTYNFEDITEFRIVIKGMITSSVAFNGNAFTFEGSQGDIEDLKNILTDNNYRINQINIKTSYLCNVIPKEQYYNKYLRGITISVDNQIVLHNDKNNYLVNPNDIVSAQILMDNSVTTSKGTNANSFTSLLRSCHTMSVKVNTTGQSFVIDVLPNKTFNQIIKEDSTEYQESLAFSNKILQKIGELNGKW